MRAFVPALEKLRRRGLPFLILLVLTVVPAGLEGQSVRRERGDSAATVWVNTGSGVYHCAGTRYYGNTRVGTYLSETAARGQGYRPAYGRVCGAIAVASDSAPTRGAVSTALPARGTVWVNTSSGVYHCPGTRYYGTTKRGKYMTEAEARAEGNRPAYGKTCS
jgi:hypothetical protein